jgi:hypothetical protein
MRGGFVSGVVRPYSTPSVLRAPLVAEHGERTRGIYHMQFATASPGGG